MTNKETYTKSTWTQEQWSRVIGWGIVPEEYKKKDSNNGTSTDKRRKQSK